MSIPYITKPAAVAALVRREEAEERRAVLWECVPIPARMVALMCASLPRERATEPLVNFTRKERELIALNVGILTSQLNTAVFAMRDTEATSILLN
jgi:hypothetical protein